MALQLLAVVGVILPLAADPARWASSVGVWLVAAWWLLYVHPRLYDRRAAQHRPDPLYVPRHAAPLKGAHRLGALLGVWIDPGDWAGEL